MELDMSIYELFVITPTDSIQICRDINRHNATLLVNAYVEAQGLTLTDCDFELRRYNVLQYTYSFTDKSFQLKKYRS